MEAYNAKHADAPLDLASVHVQNKDRTELSDDAAVDKYMATKDDVYIVPGTLPTPSAFDHNLLLHTTHPFYTTRSTTSNHCRAGCSCNISCSTLTCLCTLWCRRWCRCLRRWLWRSQGAMPELRVPAAVPRGKERRDWHRLDAPLSAIRCPATGWRHDRYSLPLQQSENTDTACLHHTGPPVFHEGRKGWSCCKDNAGGLAYDWDGFMKIKGCARGRHSTEKKPDV